MKDKKKEIAPEIQAVIAMALYETLGSKQSGGMITFQGNSGDRRYSPWSSKILTLRKMPGQY